MIAPLNFSLYSNPEETLSFFAKIEGKIREGKPVHFDMQKIEMLTIDAIMYFLAMLKKIKMLNIIYGVRGSVPKNENCKLLLQMSGFFDYVHSSSMTPELSRDTSIIQIATGQNAETDVAKKLCLFTMSKLGVNRQDISRLYQMIIELMTNTKQHAYNDIKRKFITTDWYVFAKYDTEANAVRFIFLDTGEGIPSTVKKAFRERLYEIAPFIGKSQTSYIQSTLEGKLRTRTGIPYRGKGLPKIYSFYKDGHIKDLTIISNYGYFGNKRSNDIHRELNGALFYWELSKGNDQ
ncbi:ATP-binding protein [Patescibacteria group bacterium]|nr:ATP-binding protein [Patescibacteria group bacterium]